RLEGPTRRMRAARPARYRSGDDPGQLVGRPDRRTAAGTDDRGRDAPRPPFLAEPVQDVGELILRVGGHDVGRGPTLASHPHVEGTGGPVAEPALRTVEVHRGDAEVEEDAAGAFDPRVASRVIQLRESALDGHETLSELRQRHTGLAERVGIT